MLSRNTIPIACPPEDLVARYDRTFLRYKGIVHFVRYSGGNFRLESRRGRETRFRIDPYDPRLDSSSIPLGFCWNSDGAIYVRRSPRRRWKQGVCEDILAEQLPSNYMWNDCMWDMLEGIYPSSRRAISLLQNNEYREVPISRSMKLRRSRSNSKGLSLHFKNDGVVGFLPDFDTDTFVIHDVRTSYALSPYLSDIKWRLDDD